MYKQLKSLFIHYGLYRIFKSFLQKTLIADNKSWNFLYIYRVMPSTFANTQALSPRIPFETPTAHTHPSSMLQQCFQGQDPFLQYNKQNVLR